MTLIEVLLEYQRLLQRQGRRQADFWLKNTTDRSIWWDIAHTFNEAGDFIDATGQYITMIAPPRD